MLTAQLTNCCLNLRQGLGRMGVRSVRAVSQGHPSPATPNPISNTARYRCSVTFNSTSTRPEWSVTHQVKSTCNASVSTTDSSGPES